MRRLTSLVLAFFLCLTPLLPSFAEEEAGTDESALTDPLDISMNALCFLSQKDSRLQGKTYYYGKEKLSVRGCGPVCIINTLIALAGITEQEDADALLLEGMTLLCNYKKPAENFMDPRYLAWFQGADAEAYPHVAQAVSRLGDWRMTQEEIDSTWLQQQLDEVLPTDSAATLTGRLPQKIAAETLAETILSLHEAGRDDATVILTYVTGGTDGTPGPFRNEGGHYITLYFPVGRWCESGTFCLIDSLPRAIKGEKTHTKEYWSSYAFLKGYETVSFRETWTWSRIKNTCLRFWWTEEAQTEMDSFSGDRDELVARWTEQIALLRPYGCGIIFVSIPGEYS